MKLNLRDLFWLIFVSAVATMWWIDRSKLADRLKFYETPPEPVGVTRTLPQPPPLAQPPFQSYPAIDPFGPPPPAPFPASAAPSADDPLAPNPMPVEPPPADPFG